MSLINQVLRDLDGRQASALERDGIGVQVRALPPRRRFPWMRALPVAVGLSLGVAGLWVLLDSQPGRHAEQDAPVPALVVAMPADTVTMPSGAETASIGALRLDLDLGSPPKAPPLAARATVSPALPATAEPAPPPARLPIAAAIDKQPRVAAIGSAEDEYRKAMAAHRQGRVDEALEGLRNALRLDARHAAARQALLSLLVTQQRWPEAQAVAEAGLAVDATRSGWAMILARLQLEQGQLAEAEQTMARHEAPGVLSADYDAFHGLLLEKLGRGEEARAAFLRAQESGKLSPPMAAAVEQRLR